MNVGVEGKVRTSGVFSDEPAAWAVFDAAIELSGAFRIYREVEGEYIQPRPETDPRGARIDRILVPQPKVIAAGWKRGGMIGVEGKKSGSKIGPLVTQAIDYSRCAFRIEREPGELIALVMLPWIFIYPVEPVLGDLASVMANNRIGTAAMTNSRLVFSCNGTNAITIAADGSLFGVKDLPMGSKRGSR